jgi:hypothetical protein
VLGNLGVRIAVRCFLVVYVCHRELLSEAKESENDDTRAIRVSVRAFKQQKNIHDKQTMFRSTRRYRR